MNKEQIKKARQLLSLSQTDFAFALGWKDKKQVSNLECGVREPQKQTILAIERLLDVAGKLGEFKDESSS